MLATSRKVRCSYCSWDKNPIETAVCEICRKPLLSETQNSDNSNPTKKLTLKKTKKDIGIAFCALVLAGGAIAVAVRREVEPPIETQKIVTSSSDIQLYSSIGDVPDVPAGTFNYGGAICFAAMQRDGMNDAIAQAHPQFGLRYLEPEVGNPGCATGIQMLLDKQLSFAQNGRPLTDEEIEQARARGFQLESVPVAIDGTVFFVHPDIRVKNLNLEQIRGIYRGEITNWQQVGGPDLAVTPVSQDPQTNSTLKRIMRAESEPEVGNVKVVRDYTAAMREVGSTPGAISYASAAIARGQQSVRFVAIAESNATPPVMAMTSEGEVNLEAFEEGVYPLTRRLFVVTRRDGTLDEKAGTAYANLLLSEEGQEIVEKAGFVPLRTTRN